MEYTKPITARFTASQPTRIVSPDGSMCQNFKAGETAPVHRKMFSVAVAAGLMPEDPLEIAEKTTEAVEEPRKSREDLVHTGLIEACRTLIVRGNPKDFTLAQGLPRASSVKKLVDFKFTAQDVKRAFEEAMHEVNQSGNDSTEHSEPSSSVAE